MPPFTRSRHSFTEALTDEQGRVYLTSPEPYRYRDLPDNVAHRVGEGDSLFTLASRYFRPLPDAAQLWWVIADFQEDPILDPTVSLTPGTILFIPSMATLLGRIFAESRRDDS